MPRAVEVPLEHEVGPTVKDRKLTPRDKFQRRMGFTHKAKPKGTWMYLKHKTSDEVAGGRIVMTFTDQGGAYRSYYAENVVQLV